MLIFFGIENITDIVIKIIIPAVLIIWAIVVIIINSNTNKTRKNRIEELKKELNL